jgi:monoamine oxidase
VVVIGAGYCGLTACRDAATNGLRVLLLEARDRIGGRSWSSNMAGYPFERGGTWVHWGQPHVWREISRYDMWDQIETSFDFSRGINQHLIVDSTETKKISHDEEVRVLSSPFRNFDFDLIQGGNCRKCISKVGQC